MLMPQITYKVTLAADGKHTVSATSDTPTLAKVGLQWAQETLAEIVEWSTAAGKGQRDDPDVDAGDNQALGHQDLKTTSIYVGLAREVVDKELQENAL